MRSICLLLATFEEITSYCQHCSNNLLTMEHFIENARSEMEKLELCGFLSDISMRECSIRELKLFK